MSRLVNDLMALARMDSGQAILQFGEVDLSELAAAAIERLSPLASERQIQLECGTLPEIPVNGDRQYLLQMISNLLENGIKYCHAGQRVRIETGMQDGHALLRVSDTGPGIAAEHLSAVFDRFYRADNARTHNGEDGDAASGNGLGLSIVAWIVRAHGGTIGVESRVNEGTTFEVSLPLATAAQPSAIQMSSIDQQD